MSLPNMANIKLQIWDTAGQERFRNISKAYIRGADVICALYDITKPSSFENMRELINPEVQSPDIVKFIVGNKSDMEEERQVTFDEGKKFADEKGYEFREVSAANGQGVNDLFLSAAKAAYRKKNPGSLTGWSSSATSFFKKK
ncbi:ras-related protein Rab-14-like [Mizuhopecten yessoensis]|nr:ras-related protein Rab-14-like [Mizuhopecten yessoensis]